MFRNTASLATMSSSCSRGRSRSPVQQGGVGKDGGGGSGDQQQPVKKDEKGVALRPMQVFVKADEDRVGVLIDVWPWDTIHQAKEKIYWTSQMPLLGCLVDVCSEFCLYDANVVKAYRAQRAEVPKAFQLVNDATLRDQGVHHGDTLCVLWNEVVDYAEVVD